jgi:hypothetical protein
MSDYFIIPAGNMRTSRNYTEETTIDMTKILEVHKVRK